MRTMARVGSAPSTLQVLWQLLKLTFVQLLLRLALFSEPHVQQQHK